MLIDESIKLTISCSKKKHADTAFKKSDYSGLRLRTRFGFPKQHWYD